MDNNLLKHYNHPFYAKVDQITDEVKLMQIRKGAEKYPEPFTPSSWTGKELAIHALQELRDGQVYVVGMLERIEELEEDNKRLRDLNYHNNLPAMKSMNEDIERYKRAIDEICVGDGCLEGPDAERELDRVTTIVWKVKEESECK